MKDGKNYNRDKEYLFSKMSERYLMTKKAIEKHKDSTLLTPYPFNSGYFMAFDTNGRDAESLRLYLLEKYAIGTINIMGHSLRLAYCSVEKEMIEDLIDMVYKGAEEIWS